MALVWRFWFVTCSLLQPNILGPIVIPKPFGHQADAGKMGEGQPSPNKNSP